MEQNQLIVAIIAVALVLAGAYFLLSGGTNGGKYSGVSIDVAPTGTAQLPRRNCFMGVEPIFGGGGARVTFACAFMITNYGEDLPAGSDFYLVFNEEPAAKATLDSRYANGSVVFGGKKDFTFTKEFKGSEYSAQNIHTGGRDFEYKLIYCIGCENPLTEGKVIYTNSTKYCCKLPSVSIGSPANPCD